MVDYKQVSQLFSDPMFISGISQFNPRSGEMLLRDAEYARQNEQQQWQRAEQEARQQERLRAAQVQEQLPQVLGQIDWENPNQAAMQLAQIGVPPEEMAKLFNLYRGSQELGLGREELGLKKEGLGLQRARFGLEQQEHNLKLQQLQQAMAAAQAGLLSPEDAMKIEQELRKELTAQPLTKEFNTVKSAFKKVETAAKNPSPANDVALIYGYMKLLDPGSVVRESEYATAQNAAGVPDQIRNLWKRVLDGERLNERQRADFSKSARQIYKSQVETYKPIVKEYKSLAEKYKVKPENVILINPEEEVLGEETPENNVSDVAGARAEAIRRGLIRE